MLLVITACISVGEGIPGGVSIHDSSDRLRGYLETIDWAIEETGFRDILFGDNSDYDLESVSELHTLREKARKKGKNLECYHFRGNGKAVREKGKGYGEGEILLWLYEHCPTMKKHECYYKITGRLTIHNIRQMHLSKKAENTFVFDVGSGTVDTRFYRLSMKDYELFFKDAYLEVDDAKNCFLEHVYFRALIRNHLAFGRFNRTPEFRGRSGTTGTEYSEIYHENRLHELAYHSFLYRTYFGRYVLKYIRRIVVKE